MYDLMLDIYLLTESFPIEGLRLGRDIREQVLAVAVGESTGKLWTLLRFAHDLGFLESDIFTFLGKKLDEKL